MSRRIVLATIAVVLLLPAAWLWAQSKSKTPLRRAEPPKFNRNDPFYEDAFAAGLSGERPANLGQAAVAAPPTPGAAPASVAGGEPSPAPSGGGWSAIISATTLEDEIKTQRSQADRTITTPSDFAGNGYKAVRRDFSIVAMVFAIIAEYDDEVRWKKDAAAQRDAFARTAANAKVGTTGVYNEAKLRKQDLTDLISGQSPAAKEAEPNVKWGELINRSPLMQRLDASRDEKIGPWTASAADFNANQEMLLHEAQIFAAIGEVLKKEGMADASDTEYQEMCDILIAGARDLAQAAKEKNHDAASKAASVVSTSCDKCHELYR
jgi:soluble cytochrome b562